MKQPIYIIHKKDFDRVVQTPRSTWVYGLYFGSITCDEEYLAMLNEIKFDENDQVLVSKAMEAINKRFTAKMIGNANGHLEYLKYRINQVRKPKEL